MASNWQTKAGAMSMLIRPRIAPIPEGTASRFRFDRGLQLFSGGQTKVIVGGRRDFRVRSIGKMAARPMGMGRPHASAPLAQPMASIEVEMPHEVLPARTNEI
jgi:hypothetical protein